ncbi:hypothetical protein BKA61DRAFT_691780 [Leptodontidium sp. MPI-SDFR-AT-0119]|nr:hypothetical protein BKA61DRAFT_691780 [Leptodontidium sp. MPI-SDFR-AT-0119]
MDRAKNPTFLLQPFQILPGYQCKAYLFRNYGFHKSPRTRPKRPLPSGLCRPHFFLPGEQGPIAALPATATASAIIRSPVNNYIQNCLVHSRLPTTYERASNLRHGIHSTPPTFYTFHNNTTVIPAEITSQILGYIVADARPPPLGGGVKNHVAHSVVDSLLLKSLKTTSFNGRALSTTLVAHHPVASVSREFRSVYLNHPYSTSTKGRETTPVKVRIGEALEFCDLRTLVAFFEDGPSRDALILQHIQFLSISYIDDHTATGWGQRTTDYAYEAFQHLHKHWASMRISWLRICLPSSPLISSVDDPRIWSLLKIRNLPHLTILGPRGCIAPEVRKHLKARTQTKKLFPWRPLGLETVGGRAWRGQMTWQEHYRLLDSRYKYLHDRETVTERRKMQRDAYETTIGEIPVNHKPIGML